MQWVDEVPEQYRSWAAAYPGYAPVDITPPELIGDGLIESASEGWAEPYFSPLQVPNWPARQRAALVPFVLDEWGWPLNPAGRTGRCGRNLGRWGENQAADPIVVAGEGAHRQVLLILRGDVAMWAIPGGMVDPGELAPQTLRRELGEETGIDLAQQNPTILVQDYVDDHRATDHAWVTTTAALFTLDEPISAQAGDDAVDAAWFPFSSLAALDVALRSAGRELYAPHRPLLQRALEQLGG